MIKITDPRIDADIVCVSQENVSVQIIPEPIQKTYKSVLEDGTISDVVVNEPPTPRDTTLKDEIAKLSNLEMQISADQQTITNAQDKLVTDTAERDAQQIIVDQMTLVISEALQAQTERIALLPPVEVPPEEPPLEP